MPLSFNFSGLHLLRRGQRTKSLTSSGVSRRVVALALIILLLAASVPPVVAQSLAREAASRTFLNSNVLLEGAKGFVQRAILTLPLHGPRSSMLKEWIRGSSKKDTPQRPDENRGIRPSPPQSKADRQARVASLRLNPRGDITLNSGDPVLFTAIPLDVEGNAIHGLRAEWESSDRQIIFITKGGKAIAGNPGRATLTARAGRAREIISVRVTAGTNDRLGGKKKSDSTRTTRRGAQNYGDQSIPPVKQSKSFLAAKRRRNHAGDIRRGNDIRSASGTTPPLVIPQRPPWNDPLPDDETVSLYQASNAVGSPPGKTKPGALTPASATAGTENGNKNFTFGLPIGGLAGRGLDVSLSLVYNSQLWNKSTSPGDNSTWMSYDVDSGWPAPGFRLGFGQIEDQGSYGFTLTDVDGTRHALVYTSASNYDTKDGTFIHYQGGAVSGTLYYADGTMVTYASGGGGYRIYPTQITDRNGNLTTISYVDGVGPKISSITDTLQRYVNFYYDSNGDLVTITAPGLSGDRQLMRFYYQDITLSTGIFASGINVSTETPASIHTLQYVYYPGSSDGTGGAFAGYRFDYRSHGTMYQITQLRGMTVSSNSTSSAGTVSSDGSQATQTTYDYPASPTGLTDAPIYGSRSDEWAGRTNGGSAPSYSFSTSTDTTNSENVSTITAPDGTVQETRTIIDASQWDDGLVKKTIVTDGTNTLAETSMEWETDANGLNPRVHAVKAKTYSGSAALTRASVFSYTSYNNVSAVSERDFTTDGSISTTELRRTETTYVNSSAYTGRHLLHLPSTVQVFPGGSSTPAARVDYGYDAYGISHGNLTGRDDIIMHDPAFDPFQQSQEVNCRWECISEYDGNCITWAWVCDYYNPYDSATDYRGNVTSVTTYPDATSTSGTITHSTTYDIAGNVMTAQVDCCQLKSFTYSGGGTNGNHDYAYPISVTSGNPSGLHLTTSATFDYDTGLPATGTDENSQVTTSYYNSDSLRLEHVTYPDGGASYVTYSDALSADANGKYHSYVETSAKLDGSGGSTRYVSSRRYFDGRGAVTRTMSNYTATNGWSTQDIEYDAMGRAYRASNPYFAANDSAAINSAGFWTTSAFDHLGRVTQVTMPRGDNDNSLTTSVSSSYDGVYTTVTDQAGKTRRQKINALGRLIRLDEPTSSGLGDVSSPNQPSVYDYDVLGNLVHINQGSQDRYFKYDSLSRLIREKQVEQETNSSYNLSDSLTGNSSWTRKIEYNSSGLVTYGYDARGVHTTFSYDDLNRVTQVSYSNSTPTAHYYYDASLPSGAPSYTPQNAQGRLTAMTYGSGTPTTGNYFAYDANGRVVTQKQVTGSTTYSLSYTYNYAGMLTGETYPSSRALAYAYDEGGRLASVVGDGTTTFANSFSYEAHGGLASETFGNAMVHALEYNKRLQANKVKLSQTVSSVTTVLQQYDYGYGEFNTSTGSVDTSKNNGQIGKVTGTISGTAQWNQGFSYDELSRLANVAEHTGSTMTTQTYSQGYTYDVYGNRFQSANSMLGLQAVSSSDVTAGTNRFVSGVASYDAAGNITTDSKFRSLKYEYDANGRQSAVKLLDDTSVQSAVYDCAGQRVQTTADGVTRTMVYDIFGQNVTDYLGSSGSTLERENIYRGGLLAVIEASMTAPAALSAAPSSGGTNINLSWSALSGATNYRVIRSATKNGPYTYVGATSSTSMTDSGVTSGHAYLYKVCAADGSNNCTSAYSNVAMSSAVTFATDPTITTIADDSSGATITTMKAAHITELRTAINVVRSLAGLSAGTWTHSTLTPQVTEIGKDDINDLRANLDEALTGLGLQTSTYTDSTLAGAPNGTVIKGAHITELRTRASSATGGGGSSSGGVTYVLTDAQGSTRAVMSNNGSSSAIVARHDYLPFGEEIASGSGRSTTPGYAAMDTNRQKYGLTERDGVSGLDHTAWRKYESFSGRWTSPDPLSGSIGDPQSFNRYAYVQNDPVNLVDPSGLTAMLCFYSGWINTLHYKDGHTETYITANPTVCIPIYGYDDGFNQNRISKFIDREPQNSRVGASTTTTRRTPYVDQNVLNDCTKKLFGVETRSFTESRRGSNGSFTGFGPDQFTASSNGLGPQMYGNDTTITVVNEVSAYTSAQMITFYNQGKPPSQQLPANANVTGYTGSTPSGYTPYRNFTASNVRNPMEILKTQVHELGHSLARITGVGFDQNNTPEGGWKLEDCVRNGGGFKYR